MYNLGKGTFRMYPSLRVPAIVCKHHRKVLIKANFRRLTAKTNQLKKSTISFTVAPQY